MRIHAAVDAADRRTRDARAQRRLVARRQIALQPVHLLDDRIRLLQRLDNEVDVPIGIHAIAPIRDRQCLRTQNSHSTLPPLLTS